MSAPVMVETRHTFAEGDRVRVQANDYTYEGWIVSIFAKRSGQVRCVVEDEHGRLFIHNSRQVGRDLSGIRTDG